MFVLIIFVSEKLRNQLALLCGSPVSVNQGCADLVPDESVCVCREAPAIVAVCRLAEANTSDLIQIIVAIDAVLTRVMNFIFDYLSNQPEVLFYFSLLILCERHDAAAPPLHGRKPDSCR